MEVVSIITFRAEFYDIAVVANLLSDALFGGIPFSPCTSGRMGSFPAVQLDRDMLGLSVYLVRMDSRDPHEFTIEFERDAPTAAPSDDKRCALLLGEGILLSDYVAEFLQAIPGISVST